uniref:Chromosome 4 open reading frame 33 n=1 Tax=Laticauda laticaudata TaxID=8630 RepID=A0A8C5SI04_LATLA
MNKCCVILVVEAFFLNYQTQQYLEVELCPHGQHFVLFLCGKRNICRKELPLKFEVSRATTKWRGHAHLPWNFFPPNTDRFNAFAIHGTDVNRTYEALYPIPQNEVHFNQKPDLSLNIRKRKQIVCSTSSNKMYSFIKTTQSNIAQPSQTGKRLAEHIHEHLLTTSQKNP